MKATTQEILVIDDEIQIRRLLDVTLGEAGYRVTLAESAAGGIREAESYRFDAVILDLGLQDADGIEVLKKIRGWSQLPVIILSVRSSETDIVSALDAGANDYLTKPFRSGELLARLRTAIHNFQTGGLKSGRLHLQNLEIDLDKRSVMKNSVAVKLTPTEFSLLSLFLRNAGKVLTHTYILQQVWGPKFVTESQYTRVYVGQLRKKLEADPERPQYILTEPGIGYRFIADE